MGLATQAESSDRYGRAGCCPGPQDHPSHPSLSRNQSLAGQPGSRTRRLWGPNCHEQRIEHRLRFFQATSSSSTTSVQVLTGYGISMCVARVDGWCLRHRCKQPRTCSRVASRHLCRFTKHDEMPHSDWRMSDKHRALEDDHDLYWLHFFSASS